MGTKDERRAMAVLEELMAVEDELKAARAHQDRARFRLKRGLAEFQSLRWPGDTLSDLEYLAPRPA